jgi:ketopantoate reductase
MNIAIVGPGAIGILFSATLIKAGQNVWLLDHNKQRAEAISKNGITLESRDRPITMRLKLRMSRKIYFLWIYLLFVLSLMIQKKLSAL